MHRAHPKGGEALRGVPRWIFSPFRLRTRDVLAQSSQYLSGLMQARKKNTERMAQVVPESAEQALQHFLSNSSWDERRVLDQLALEADALLGGTRERALLIDERAVTEKGNKSVGVARQWNGRLGTIDNCQVGVYVALTRGNLSTLIDTRLYLPSSWVRDKGRCKAAGVTTKDRAISAYLVPRRVARCGSSKQFVVPGVASSSGREMHSHRDLVGRQPQAPLQGSLKRGRLRSAERVWCPPHAARVHTG